MSEQCSAKVSPDSWGRRVQCAKAGKVQRGERWYCTIHDPERVAAKQAERIAAHDAERALSQANMNGAQRLLDQVKALTGAYPVGMPYSDWRTGRYTGDIVLSTAALSALLVRAASSVKSGEPNA